MKVSYREKFVALHEHIIVPKILSIDWEIKGKRYTIKKNLVSLLSRGVGVTTFGIYLRPQKIEVNFGGGATFGGSLLSKLYGNILDSYIQRIENFGS